MRKRDKKMTKKVLYLTAESKKFIPSKEGRIQVIRKWISGERFSMIIDKG